MIVYPHQGIDRIQFGMSRTDVEGAVGMAPNRFKRSRYALSDEDLFEGMSFTVLYDEDDRCNAIGVARDVGVELKYHGYQLFAHPARTVRDWARARDPELDPRYGFTSKLLGLNMWADWIDEDDLEPDELEDPALSFLVFQPGYWENEQARAIRAGLMPHS